MSYEQILFDTADEIGTITLNRPERLNAHTPRMLEEMYQALDRVEKDDSLRVTIITGAGRGFCAGADLSAGAKTFDRSQEKRPAEEEKRLTAHPLRFCFGLTKPVIVAINGPAVGIGITMILPFDIRIAAESARIGFIFNRRGILPELSSPWLLPKIIGISKAAELMYTGRILNAQEALDYGLVSQVVPDDELMDKARELATEIAVNCAPVSIALTKSMLYGFLTENDLDKVERVNDDYVAWLGQQPDAKEGVVSFLEKRPPRWSLKVPSDLPEPFPFT
ncbi:MAG: enoyl-CoA hydratase-related protein [Candidatus Hydrogenedentes bacterium]|nr:enoyl-CoA hydratase-related protein [Candidatus Hydrogenedentota bacterium]